MHLKKDLPLNLGILLCCFFITVQAQEIPQDYKLVYEEDFEGDVSLNDFGITDPTAWRITQGKEGQGLELYGESNYEPRVRSPRNIAYIKNKKLGSFILEADLQQTGKEYGHRDLCLFFGIKDSSNFYYVHMASNADPNAHNIFLVNDAPRTNIATKTTEGIDWGATNEWHKIRLERDIKKGTVKVFFDDMQKPIMEADDKHFDYGYAGFGSFDDSGKIDNIKIWAPSLAPKKERFFKN